jgi:hypothetical protein
MQHQVQRLRSDARSSVTQKARRSPRDRTDSRPSGPEARACVPLRRPTGGRGCSGIAPVHFASAWAGAPGLRRCTSLPPGPRSGRSKKSIRASVRKRGGFRFCKGLAGLHCRLDGILGAVHSFLLEPGYPSSGLLHQFRKEFRNHCYNRRDSRISLAAPPAYNCAISAADWLSSSNS